MMNFLFYRRNSKISCDSKIYPLSVITNSSIGNLTYLSYMCQVNNTKIGNFCSIAKGVSIGLGFHPLKFISTSPVFYSPNNPLKIKLVNVFKYRDSKPVEIGNDVWIGVNSIILDGVKIGDGAIIAANSVVNRNVEPYSIVGGVPAKLIRKRFDDKLIDLLLESKWWDLPLKFFKDSDIKNIFSNEIDESQAFKLLNKIKIFKNDFEY